MSNLEQMKPSQFLVFHGELYQIYKQDQKATLRVRKINIILCQQVFICKQEAFDQNDSFFNLLQHAPKSLLIIFLTYQAMNNQVENQENVNIERLTLNQKKMLDVYLHPFFVPLTDYTTTMIHLQMQLATALTWNARLIQQGKRSGYFNRPYGTTEEQKNSIFKNTSKYKVDSQFNQIKQEEPKKPQSAVEMPENSFKNDLKVQPNQAEFFVKGSPAPSFQFDLPIRNKSSQPDLQKEDNQINSTKKQSYYKIKIIIKNFALAIFSFIKINRVLKKKVLQKFNIPSKDFQKFIDEVKDQIESINDFKILWTQEGNKYHKAFRIFSYKYLNQKCIPQIFLSRVDNNQTHLKYRALLLENLKNPENINAYRIN